jgi:hypothetical protein
LTLLIVYEAREKFFLFRYGQFFIISHASLLALVYKIEDVQDEVLEKRSVDDFGARGKQFMAEAQKFLLGFAQVIRFVDCVLALHLSFLLYF